MTFYQRYVQIIFLMKPVAHWLIHLKAFPAIDLPIGQHWFRWSWHRTGNKTLSETMMAFPNNKVHGANMGPIWDRQDPCGPDERCYLGCLLISHPVLILFSCVSETAKQLIFPHPMNIIIICKLSPLNNLCIHLRVVALVHLNSL